MTQDKSGWKDINQYCMYKGRMATRFKKKKINSNFNIERQNENVIDAKNSVTNKKQKNKPEVKVWRNMDRRKMR